MLREGKEGEVDAFLQSPAYPRLQSSYVTAKERVK